MPLDVVIGLDVGTQSSKLVAVTAGGEIVAEERVGHGVSRPAPGQFEQDAEEVWWHDTVALLRRLDLEALTPQALCVSGIGPTALLTDEAGTPLRPGILYGVDTRAQTEIGEVQERYGGDGAIAICGSAISSQSPVPKLLWLARHEPEAFAATRQWHTAHAWLAQRLTGAYAIDHHSASQAAPLYDVAEARWRDDLWRELLPGIAAPALVWPGERLGGMIEAAAQATGLPIGTPVVMGTIDAWAECYSAYADRPGAAMIMYGSTYFFIANSDRFTPSRRFWGTRSVARDTFSLAGGMATGGLVLDWLARFLSTDVKSLVERALAAGLQPSQLIAMPYLAGERTPFADPDVRGVLFGLDLDSDSDTVARAFITGLALAVRDNLDEMRAEISGGRDYVAVGGGASSSLLLRLVSNVAAISQSVPRRTIGAALGDARLAAEALGWQTPQATWNPIDRVVLPDPEAAGAYEDTFARFKELYHATRHLQRRHDGSAH